MRRALRVLKWLAVGTASLVVLLLLPVGYVELFCGQDPDQAEYQPVISDPAFQRAESNSYLTYPEWHIVYAYEGLANILKTGDEHAFGYTASVTGFWTSFCALNREAGRHGAADFNIRATIHTIGVSFTLEMAMKALYEETLGRLTAILRGSSKTPQDTFSARMAADYAAFLQQTPWYKYDFNTAVTGLWQQPMSSWLRGWERRLGLGAEWKAKAAYAQAIAGAVAATGQAQLRIRTVVGGMRPSELAAIADVEIIDNDPERVIIETPRYRRFTHILQDIAGAGGKVIEIAGNDDIMASLIEPTEMSEQPLGVGRIVSRIGRDGYDGNRVLVGLKVDQLTDLMAETGEGRRTLEHVYDY